MLLNACRSCVDVTWDLPTFKIQMYKDFVIQILNKAAVNHKDYAIIVELQPVYVHLFKQKTYLFSLIKPIY